MLAAFTWSGTRAWLSDHGGKVLGIFAVALVINYVLKTVVPPAIGRAVLRDTSPRLSVDLRKRADTLGSVLVRTAQTMVLLIAGLMILDELGFTVAPFLTGLGIGGIAIGLGAQSLVRDTINGIFILVENQYGRGDLISVAGVQGWVEDINFRRTVVRDADGTLFTIPNGEIKVSGNLTRGYSGVNILVPLAGTADIDRAIALINDAGEDLAQSGDIGPLVVEPPHVARLEAITDKAVMLRVMGKTAPGSQFEVAGALRRRIKRAFEQAKLPFGEAPAPPPAAPPSLVPPPVRPPS
jgi:small conductance mechanosensitive channel